MNEWSYCSIGEKYCLELQSLKVVGKSAGIVRGGLFRQYWQKKHYISSSWFSIISESSRWDFLGVYRNKNCQPLEDSIFVLPTNHVRNQLKFSLITCCSLNKLCIPSSYWSFESSIQNQGYSPTVRISFVNWGYTILKITPIRFSLFSKYLPFLDCFLGVSWTSCCCFCVRVIWIQHSFWKLKLKSGSKLQKDFLEGNFAF